jgi:hypothetical protein
MKSRKDIERMKKYHRTGDMINLLTYFPELSPIKDLTIIENEKDYYENIDYCSGLKAQRNDTLRSKPSMKSIEGKGHGINILDVIEKVKNIDKDGVVVLFNLTNKPSERYDRYAGISVGVSVGRGVYIDAVSKGFDGREVSKGLDVHERYYIPWFDIKLLNIQKLKEYRTYLISTDKYVESRSKRLEFLKSVGIDEKVALKEVPEVYEEIPEFIWEDVLKKILKRLLVLEAELKMFGFTEFAISGHTEGKCFMPWQMFDKSRYNFK